VQPLLLAGETGDGTGGEPHRSGDDVSEDQQVVHESLHSGRCI
jgi:hypothetical protein